MACLLGGVESEERWFPSRVQRAKLPACFLRTLETEIRGAKNCTLLLVLELGGRRRLHGEGKKAARCGAMTPTASSSGGHARTMAAFRGRTGGVAGRRHLLLDLISASPPAGDRDDGRKKWRNEGDGRSI